MLTLTFIQVLNDERFAWPLKCKRAARKLPFGFTLTPYQ